MSLISSQLGKARSGRMGCAEGVATKSLAVLRAGR